jgi:hypothetical protein
MMPLAISPIIIFFMPGSISGRALPDSSRSHQ